MRTGQTVLAGVTTPKSQWLKWQTFISCLYNLSILDCRCSKCDLGLDGAVTISNVANYYAGEKRQFWRTSHLRSNPWRRSDRCHLTFITYWPEPVPWLCLPTRGPGNAILLAESWRNIWWTAQKSSKINIDVSKYRPILLFSIAVF